MFSKSQESESDEILPTFSKFWQLLANVGKPLHLLEFCLPSLGNFWQFLTTFGNLSQLLATAGNFWYFIAAIGRFWQLWATIGNFWQFLATLGNFCRLLVTVWITIGRFWQPLEIFSKHLHLLDKHWQLLENVPGFRRLLLILNNFLQSLATFGYILQLLVSFSNSYRFILLVAPFRNFLHLWQALAIVSNLLQLLRSRFWLH